MLFLCELSNQYSGVPIRCGSHRPEKAFLLRGSPIVEQIVRVLRSDIVLSQLLSVIQLLSIQYKPFLRFVLIKFLTDVGQGKVLRK